MYYASFGILALILNMIINHDYILRKKDKPVTLSHKRYSSFVIGLGVYSIVDILWGFLYALRIVPLVYADTVMYFLSMALSVLLWTRFVVAYLANHKKFGRLLVYAGWTVLLLEVVCLIVNFFIPIIFTFDQNKEYVPMEARYITLVIQVVLFVLASCYTIVVAVKSSGKIRIRNATVGASGIVMSIFIVLQILYPFLPLFSIGTIIGMCVIHIFVEEDIKLDQAKELVLMQKKAEQAHQATVEAKKKNITFNRIAESLASNYDMIYYVDTRDDSYVGYTADDAKGRLEVNRTGDDFYVDARRDLEKITRPDERERILVFLNRKYLLETLEIKKQFTADYQLFINNEEQYTRLIVRKTASGEHFIVAVENVDEEVRREKKQAMEYDTQRMLARHDGLTKLKNKTAYKELVESVQNSIDRGISHLPFAIAVCDINDLKWINDTKGHQAGDEYICDAGKLLCDVFVHSPVFRIGGDEFVVFLGNEDYLAKEELLGRLRVKVFENLVKKTGPVIAVGMSSFEEGKDKTVDDVFERADALMYENKKELKDSK